MTDPMTATKEKPRVADPILQERLRAMARIAVANQGYCEMRKTTILADRHHWRDVAARCNAAADALDAAARAADL